MTKTWAFIGLLVLGLAIHDVKAAEDKAPEDLKPDTVEADLGASRYDFDKGFLEKKIVFTAHPFIAIKISPNKRNLQILFDAFPYLPIWSIIIAQIIQ